MFKLRKHIATLFIFVLLIPSTIQTMHALDNHEHTLCNAISEHHIHQQDIDCGDLHIPFKTLSVDLPSSKETLTNHLYKVNFNKQPKAIQVVYLFKKSSRAPPVLA